MQSEQLTLSFSWVHTPRYSLHGPSPFVLSLRCPMAVEAAIHLSFPGDRDAGGRLWADAELWLEAASCYCSQNQLNAFHDVCLISFFAGLFRNCFPYCRYATLMAILPLAKDFTALPQSCFCRVAEVVRPDLVGCRLVKRQDDGS